MQDGRIHVLSDHVANKIAAGEVVERPASVLKELIENALDAEAASLEVSIVAGGRKLVAVADDGLGMTRDDALLALERHATSKIRDVDDIERIATLGFRGEALAAIASVSRFRLATCPRETSAGTEISFSGGKLYDVRETGGPVGTRIEVRDLFFNVPARRKFLRTHQTELAHVRQTFIRQALAHPRVAMRLTVDDRDLYRLPAGGRDGLTDRVRDLFGADYLEHLCPLALEREGVSITGLAGLPAFSRGDRGEQYCFVNGRPTGAPLLAYAVREGYHSLLPKDRHPVLFLFIDVAADAVDVNVHPTKKEVRFRHPSDVRDGVIEALRAALATGGVRAEARENPAAAPRPVATTQHLSIVGLTPVHTFHYPGMPGLGAWPTASGPAAEPPRQDASESAPETDHAQTGDAAGAPWAWCRVVGQVGDLYVVLEIEDGMVLMDPHAAHERVLYEKFRTACAARAVPVQALLVPETITLPSRDADRVSRNLENLRSMGIGVAEFGGDSFVLDALPAFLEGVDGQALLREVARAVEESGARAARGSMKEAAIMQAACKAAVKSRDTLSLSEIERLVIDLARCEMPYTCPHGRPTLIHMAFTELNRKFGRA